MIRIKFIAMTSPCWGTVHFIF